MGGALSQAFGWRSTFAALAIMCFILGLALASIMRRDTHQYFVLQRLAKTDPDTAEQLFEWDSVMATAPKFVAPWMPIK